MGVRFPVQEFFDTVYSDEAEDSKLYSVQPSDQYTQLCHRSTISPPPPIYSVEVNGQSATLQSPHYSLDDIYIDPLTLFCTQTDTPQTYGLGLYVSGGCELTGNQRLSECGVLTGSRTASNSLTFQRLYTLLTSSSSVPEHATPATIKRISYQEYATPT
ncbi:LOW QUALITY PROTEIN: hypothetical protein Cgig2_019544 [Carnegiea gigantea]|uniref:Uncharacterized protein n=1 Tax=Carnegiea gigantea TaxID=171969 RepID=A0A9Q1KHJ7_9CARY|nr:LOW QUALITY PROTEIN: hypothetical protein Cgig2_019544 [Carnegiea gigantea]